MVGGQVESEGSTGKGESLHTYKGSEWTTTFVFYRLHVLVIFKIAAWRVGG